MNIVCVKRFEIVAIIIRDSGVSHTWGEIEGISVGKAVKEVMVLNSFPHKFNLIHTTIHRLAPSSFTGYPH